MTRKKKIVHKKQRKKKNTKRNNETDTSDNRPLTWVEKLAWQPIECSPTPTPIVVDSSSSSATSFTVVSWNVLAEAYTSRRSHPCLPLSYQSVVFDRRKRRSLMMQTLKRLATTVGVDIFCLQEVDLPEHVTNYLQRSLGYQACQTPTNKAGGGISGRVDACAIFFSTEQFEWLDHDRFPPQVVHLDGVASLGRTTANGTTMARSTSSSSSSSLACLGLSSSFLRHNMALVVALRHKATQQTLVVVNTHLYWHPGFEYVKLCQMHYVLQRVRAFTETISSSIRQPGDNPSHLPTTIICGDLNSLPKSSVHQYLAQGTVNAKRVAPWYYFWRPTHDGDDENEGGEEDAVADHDESEIDNDEQHDDEAELGHSGEDVLSEDDESDVSSNEELEEEIAPMDSSTIDENDNNDSNHQRADDSISLLYKTLTNLNLEPSHPTATAKESIAVTKESTHSRDSVRYLVDFTLNRLCRWLRILGIDAEIETEAEEQLRTRDGLLKPLFDRCQNERRTLVTTSTKLAARNNCPPGTFLISPQVLPNLELALAQLLLLHGVTLEPSNFLSRCVVCNGGIDDVTDTEQKRRVLTEHKAPEGLSLELEVYECNGCGQGYWWCERPTSSASRVKNQATRLLEVCIRAGVPIKGDMSLFSFVDVEELQKQGWDGPEPLEHLNVIDWLKDEHLSHPFPLQSAYLAATSVSNADCNGEQGAETNTNGDEILPFTNVTSGFVGTLDYVFFDRQSLKQTDRLYVPTMFAELNVIDHRFGHCLPSNLWPSDHLAVGARLAFQNPSPPKSSNSGVEPQVVNDSIAASTELASSGLPVSLLYCQTVEGATSPDGTNSSSASSSADHAPACACGCVPKIRSLFEMAELRRQAKLAKLKGEQNL